MSGIDREAILRRARKLAAFNDANATPAEVANAARLLKKMLRKYQLSMEDVTAGLKAEGVEKREVYSAGRIAWWRRHVIGEVADYFDCKVVNAVKPLPARREIVYVVGCFSDAQVAAYCCAALSNYLEVSVRGLPRLGYTLLQLKESGALGLGRALAARRKIDSPAEEPPASEAWALTVVKDQLVVQGMHALFPDLDKGGRRREKPKQLELHSGAYVAGYKIGTRASMVGGIEG